MLRMPSITATPNSEMKPIAAETEKIKSGKIERDQPTTDRKGNPGDRQQAVAQRIRHPVHGTENQEQRDRNRSPRAAAWRPLKTVEFPCPHELIAVGKLDGLADPFLRFRDRAAEIAAAHAKLDRNVALAQLVIDVGSAGIERDVGKFAERNVPVGARRRRIGDLEVANRIDAAAIFGCIRPGRSMTVTFEDRGRRGAADAA